MPQIQILNGNPGFGNQLAQGLGAGLSAGIQQGISNRLDSMLKQKKELGGIRSGINQLAKQYEKGSFSPDTLQNLEKRAREFVGEGASGSEATMAAFEEYNQGISPFLKKTKASSVSQPVKVGQSNSQELTSNIAKQPPKSQIPLNFLNQPKPEGFWDRVIQGTGGGAAMDARSKEDLRAVAPGLVSGAVEGRSLGLIKTGDQDTPAGQVSKEAGKFLGIGKVYGKAQQAASKLIKPTTALGKIATGGSVGGTLSAAQQLIENGEIDPKQLGIDTAIWGGLEAFFVAYPKIMSIFKGPIQTIAKETGKPAQEIFKSAIESSKADVEKALSGDAKEINKINREIKVVGKGETKSSAESTSKKVEETPKEFFNPKQAAKEREAFGAKLPQSPFEEYFAIDAREAHKNSAKRPETRAKEAEITERVKPLEESKYAEIKDERQQLRKLQEELRSLEGSERSRVESLVGFKQKHIDKLLEDLKDLQYELKYFKKRPSEADIDAGIRKSGEEFIEHAKNPTAEGEARIKKNLENDKDYIDRAQKLMERGELPGEIRPDTHIKIKKKYLDGYQAMIDELKESNRQLKGSRDAESLKKIADNKRAMEHLKDRQKRLKADIVNQTDKIKSMKAIQGASGAFYRQQLKGLRKDVEQFQKDFFKQNIVKSQGELKTQKVAQKKFETPKEAEKLGEEIAKNPTAENINQVAEATGQKSEVVKKEVSDFKAKLEERNSKVTQGKATEGDIAKTTNEVARGTKRVELILKGLPKNIAFGFAFGLAAGLLEENTGVKIPSSVSTVIAATLGGSTSRRIGKSVGTFLAHEMVSGFYNRRESEKLKDLRAKGPVEYTKYVQSLRKRYSSKRVNEIIEASS